MIARVRLWGRTIGTVSLDAGREAAAEAQLAGEWRDRIQKTQSLSFPEK